MPIYTQAATVGQSSSGTNFTITTGPAGVTGSGGGPITFTTGAVGDLVVLTLSEVASISAVTSIATTKWTLISTFNQVSMWCGVVATGAAVDTITVTGSNTGFGFGYTIQQFVSATVGTWLPGTAVGTNPVGAPAPWAVPAALPATGATNGFLYIASMRPAGGSPAYAPGSGYGSLIGAGGFLDTTWSPSITTTATPAAVTGATGTGTSIGVYIGSYPSSSPTTNTISLTPVPMGKSWVVSQLGFECIPATTIATATTTVTMNGRLLFGNTNANGGFVQGPPYITLNAGDTLAITPTGLPTGSSAIVNLYYNEYVAGQVPDASNTV